MSAQTIGDENQVASSADDRVPPYSWYALAVLTLVYVLNFLDRTLIYILFTPIKKEMAFTDLQLALLGSTDETLTPRWLPGSRSTGMKAARATGMTMSCAIRSPTAIGNETEVSVLSSVTLISPR